MRVIIVEGVLFVALLAAGGALLYWLILQFTPVGNRIRQIRNRQMLDRAAELRCPLHGLKTEAQLVRLASGEQVCPECYKETLHA